MFCRIVLTMALLFRRRQFMPLLSKSIEQGKVNAEELVKELMAAYDK